MKDPNETQPVSGSALSVFAAVTFAVGAAGFALLLWNFERPPLTEKEMNSVRVGMSQTEVVLFLGKPNHTNDWQWVYTRPLAWGEFKVNLDDARKVKNCDFDK